MVKVNVKWNKSSYDVEVDSSSVDSFSSFTAQLFSLTFVPVDRQKLMCRGKLLRDAASLAALQDGDKIMLMGTAQPPPKEPEKKIVFEEDLSDAQKVGIVKDAVASGLRNLGNTCYMNSTLQCFRAIPELKAALKARSFASSSSDGGSLVTSQLGSLLSEMDSTSVAVTPSMFTSVFRSCFPQFAEQNAQGHWMQQDAEEALTQLMSTLAQNLKVTPSSCSAPATFNSLPDASNVIDQYFAGVFETRTRPTGSAQDQKEDKVGKETFKKLKCFIDIETNFLFQGIKKSLEDRLTLRDASLGVDVEYTKSYSILSLPKYLVVQLMRFDWKKDTKVKAKMLRKIEFPFRFDVLDFCHPSLRHQLSCARNFLKEEQDAKLGLPSYKKMKIEEKKDESATNDNNMQDVTTTPEESSNAPPLVLSTETSGFYELIGVITHKGRTADSGHYVGWCLQSGDEWMKFDDDVVTKVKADEIKALAGGGDWHMAYVLFYRRVDDMQAHFGKSIPQPLQVKKTD